MRLFAAVLAGLLASTAHAAAPIKGSFRAISVPTVQWAPSPIVIPQMKAGASSLVAPMLGAPAAQAPILAAPSLNVPIAAPQAAIAPMAAAAPQAQPAVYGTLAEMSSPNKVRDGITAGKVFDGVAPKTPDSGAPLDVAAEPEEVTREIAAPSTPNLELRFSRDGKKALKANATFATIRLLGGSGSRWYWGQFEKGNTVRILVGGQTMFVSKVEKGETKAIEKLTRADFAGVYSPALMRGKTIAQLRKKLIADLTAYNRFAKPGQPAVITPRSEVRVVRFMSYKDARSLPENHDEPVLEPQKRAAVAIPEALSETSKYLPKAVVVDLRLFGDRIPYALHEDMGKLMKAGVYFVFLSDKKQEEVEKLLINGLTNKQRDSISRYKLVIMSDDGNALNGYKGSFASAMPARRFSGQELELMGFAARGIGQPVTSKGWEFSVSLKKGVDAAEAAKKLEAGIRAMGLKTGFVTKVSEGLVTLRPQSLATAVPFLLESLRTEEGLYVNHSDLMVVSEDPGILAALQGSVQPSAHTAVRGEALVDTSLAALLGKYRENVPGDLAASASKISSFLIDKDRIGGDFYNVYMLMGHVMHSAFNWAVWSYRNTGTLPSTEALVEHARAIWVHEDAGRTKNMVPKSGETLLGYQEVMESRLRSMYEVVGQVLKVYPIAVGTELPNLWMQERYKKTKKDGTVMEHRDVLRLIYDFVVARQTPEGLEVLIVDFKTGQTPTLQNLEKDTQVQLYDLVVRDAWKKLAAPYGATGVMAPVVKTGILFIYPSGAYQPSINEWGRLKFEKFLRNVMNRIRKHNNPPAPKEEKAAKKPSKKK